MDVTGKLSGKNDQTEYLFVSIDTFTIYLILTYAKKIDTNNNIWTSKKNNSLFGIFSSIIVDQGR